MKINRKLKKGFTLVELIVVIAIVAILAAVSVVSYLAFIRQANESADIQLVKQLNTALQGDQVLNGPRSTMHEMLGAMEDNGFVVENLTKTKSGYDIVWDQENNRFALLDNEKLVYGEESYGKAKTYNIWKFADTETEAQNKKYSVYLTDEFAKNNVETSLTIGAGLDAGKYVGIRNVTYTNTNNNEEGQTNNVEGQTVIIRTNSANSELVVNAPNDTVKHFDSVGLVHIISVDNTNCYEENGKAAFTQIDSGKYKTTADAEVELLFVSNASNVTVEVVEGTVDHAHAANQGDANDMNNSSSGVYFDYDGENATKQGGKDHSKAETQLNLNADFDNNKGNEEVKNLVDNALAEERSTELREEDYWINCAATSFAGGNGSEGNPYQIANAEQLSLLAAGYKKDYSRYQNSWFVLTNDIDLSSKIWVPISNYARGKNYDQYFKGNFDGNDHEIKGLNNIGIDQYYLEPMINSTTPTETIEAAYGLFGCVTSATISNLKMADVKINMSKFDIGNKFAGFYLVGDSVGAVCGYAGTNSGNVNSPLLTLNNVHVENGTIDGYDSVGGLLGRSYGSVTLTSCSNKANITSARRSGGLIGYINNYSLQNLDNNIAEAKTSHTYGTRTLTFSDCYNEGRVTTNINNDFSINFNYYSASDIVSFAQDHGYVLSDKPAGYAVNKEVKTDNIKIIYQEKVYSYSGYITQAGENVIQTAEAQKAYLIALKNKNDASEFVYLDKDLNVLEAEDVNLEWTFKFADKVTIDRVSDNKNYKFENGVIGVQK